MIVLATTLFGIALGVRNAKKRNGTGLDQVQYATGYGIAFAILGVFLSLFANAFIFN